MSAKKIPIGQADMFAPAKTTRMVPEAPKRSAAEEAVIVFALRHQGRLFNMMDLEQHMRREVGSALGAGRLLLETLARAGTVDFEKVGSGTFRMLKVKP